MAEANIEIIPLDSATQLGESAADKVFVIGSQATAGPALWAAKAGVRAVIFHDTGVGKDEAGLSALPYLQKLGMAAACINSQTARISDGKDMLTRGVISHCNVLAEELGVKAGQPCRDAAELLRAASQFSGEPDESDEPLRHNLGEINDISIIGLDTMPLITAEDSGQIVITGSHGGLVGGGDPANATRGIAVKAAIFHDAGMCPDNSSTSRLPALDQLAIPAATVGAMSARISDAISMFDTGELSMVNKTAQELGANIGMSAKKFCELIAYS
ncbi:MAG: hypothetical protein HN731_03630 [Rhodospirillaceae bacterium]|jgi:uncharacterized protein YunC (DUF1805 family)|nr:hypothetical protein [Rhodospirillaceae bacterium]MBT4937881.1 hypothetical protein [Rhodospirillaceae bacterium]MBT7954255.1 hypothetical protein [Rhodospirillaceae bacterium]